VHVEWRLEVGADGIVNGGVIQPVEEIEIAKAVLSCLTLIMSLISALSMELVFGRASFSFHRAG